MKRLFGNPWVLLVAGIAGLAAYANFGSPLEMAAIGLPFFVVIVGTAMLARYGKAAGGGSKRQAPKSALVLWLAIGACGLAYLTWNFITDSGIIGWLNAIQARRGGGYDEKLSAITAMFYLMFAMGALLIPLSRLGRARPVGTPSQPAARGETRRPAKFTRGTLALCVCGAIVLPWVVGYGVYEYYTMRNRGEMQASYLPVDVASASDAAAHAEFVALRGRVHPEGYLSLHREHSDDATYFLPLVAPASRDRDPQVHWVVQMDHRDYSRVTQPIHAHALGGSISLTQREAFARMGVHVAADAILVSYVPTTASGEVIDESGQYWMFYLIGGGTTSLVLVITSIALGISQSVQGRRARRAVAS